MHHNHIHNPLPQLLAALLLTACATHHHTTTQPQPHTPTTTTPQAITAAPIIHHITATQPQDSILKAKLQLTIGNQSPTLSGTIRIHRDHMLQLQLTALGLVEVARLELTPDYFLIVNKIDRQYARAHWADIPQFQQLGLNYQAIQAIILGHPFIPGQPSQTSPDSYHITPLTSTTIQLAPNPTTNPQPPTTATFTINTNDTTLLQTNIHTTIGTTTATLRSDYTTHQTITNHTLPEQITLTATANNHTRTIHLQLTNPQPQATITPIQSSINLSRYHQVDIQQLLQRLQP